MSQEITAEMVKTLRSRTGIGMAKCKEALREAEGDIELAIQNLRKSGIASAVKKSEREAKEGKIVAAESDTSLALVEVNAETDFVAKNEQFQKFAAVVASEALNKGVATVEELVALPSSTDASISIDEYRALTIQSLGENLVIRRMLFLAKEPNCSYGLYSHMGGKIVTLVVLQGADNQSELARDIAMHVAAAAPEFLNPESVPQSIREQEEEIARSQLAGKPEHLLPKIVEGKMRAFYEQNCLTYQNYVKETSITISELLKQKNEGLEIKEFYRWSVGEQ